MEQKPIGGVAESARTALEGTSAVGAHDEVGDHVRPLSARPGGQIHARQQRGDVDSVGLGEKLAELHRRLNLPAGWVRAS